MGAFDGHEHLFAMSSAKLRIESEQSAENDKALLEMARKDADDAEKNGLPGCAAWEKRLE
jgi:hypothetical protein